LYFSKQLTITKHEFSYELNPLMVMNMEFILLFEAVSNVSSDVPIVQSEPTRIVVNTTRHVEHNTSTVLADYNKENYFW
jgi:hypothetical protein